MRKATRPLVLWLGVGAAALAGEGGELAGVFTVNNALPEGATLEAAVYRSGSSQPLANKAVMAEGAELAYSFPSLASGTYRVRLVAKKDGKVMALGETGEVELPGAPTAKRRLTAPAIRADGQLSGTVKVAGDFPAQRMVFVSARRTDMTHKSFMPDELNNSSFALNAGAVKDGRAEYHFENLSYGVYRVQLIGYDLETHRTQAFGELPGEVVIDLDHREHPDRSFEADFAKGAAGK